jgi:hypothetical protein
MRGAAAGRHAALRDEAPRARLPLMDTLLRGIVRLFLVPLGAVMAICVGMTVLIVAHWNAFQALADADPQAQEQWFVAFVLAGPALAMLFSLMTMYALLPASVGVLISEAFAVRSWIYHAANGGLSAWIGWSMMQNVRGEYRVFVDPTTLVAAGLAGGLAYWLVAGWSAGFWKPVRAPAARDAVAPRGS